MKSINKPYVKQYSEDGVLLNPVEKNEPQGGKTFIGNNAHGEPIFYPNRTERKRKSKLFNNRKPVNKRGKFIPGRITKAILKFINSLSRPKLATK